MTPLLRTSAFFLSLVGCATLYWAYTTYLDEPVLLQQAVVEVDIPRGAGLLTVTRELNRHGIVTRPHWFILLGYLSGQARAIKYGTYAFQSGLTPRSLLDTLVSGKVRHYPVTLVEGWTLARIRAELAHHPELRQTLNGRSDQDIMRQLVPDCHASECQHPEGWLFPSTYHVTRGATDIEVLKRAYQTMQTVLEPAWAGRASDLPYTTPYQALILASIVEKETAAPEERPAIAGVFARRLQKGMKLQTDPTIIYGLGAGFDGDIRLRDLLNDTPYNTYTRDGLPPTPIAMPGAESIKAVMHPRSGNALYFVARGNGTHQFSETLAQHQAAVDTYQRKHHAAR